MITHRQIAALGLSQLIYWGISFYLIGVLGDRMVADLGWSRALVYGGFSASLLVMGVVSPFVGRAIDTFGGRPVLMTGAGLCAIACMLLARAETVTAFYGAWVCLGVAMRCMLYDAAFASLARISGPAAKRPISYITLLGGLAGTCFWPIGHFLAEQYGWRNTMDIYAGIAIATGFLHITLPSGRYQNTDAEEEKKTSEPTSSTGKNKNVTAFLYASIIALSNGLHAGMSAHLISLLTELGLAAATAVFVASLRGIGQSTARLIDVIFGGRLHPINLNLIAAIAMPLCFALGLAGSGHFVAAAIFSFVYGGATGILTITRGTLPLVLFDHRVYGTLVGKLLVPSFLLSAAAPLIFAYTIDTFGANSALIFSIAVGAVILVLSLVLKIVYLK